MLTRIALLFIVALTSVQFATAQTSTITLKVTGLEQVKGKMGIGIYSNPDNWLGNSNQFFIGNYDITTKEYSVEIPKKLTYGTYGFTVYHDKNGNGEFDYSFGIPTELYGFSNNPRAKFSKPSFNKCAVKVNQPQQTVEIRLQGW